MTKSRIFLTVLSLSLASTLVFGCTSTQTLTVESTPVPIQITKAARPRPVDLQDVKFMVVTVDNFEEWLRKYNMDTGEDAVYVISINDYEKLTVNFAELRRYIRQQGQVIIYYETIIDRQSKAAQTKK